jgi:hypothetical protein
MRKLNLPVAAIVTEYTQTQATSHTLAKKHSVGHPTICRILKANIEPTRYAWLKSEKHSKGHHRANSVRYRLEHGL